MKQGVLNGIMTGGNIKAFFKARQKERDAAARKAQEVKEEELQPEVFVVPEEEPKFPELGELEKYDIPDATTNIWVKSDETIDPVEPSDVITKPAKKKRRTRKKKSTATF